MYIYLDKNNNVVGFATMVAPEIETYTETIVDEFWQPDIIGYEQVEIEQDGGKIKVDDTTKPIFDKKQKAPKVTVEKTKELPIVETDDFKIIDDKSLPKDFETHYENYKYISGKLVLGDVDIVAEQAKQMLLVRLSHIVTKKRKDAKALLNGADIDVAQVEAYQIKYDEIKKGELDLLKLEAELKGVEVGVLADLIVQYFDYGRDAFKGFTFLIEAFRVKAKEVITQGDLELGEKILNAGELLNEKTTPNDIKNIFK